MMEDEPSFFSDWFGGNSTVFDQSVAGNCGRHCSNRLAENYTTISGALQCVFLFDRGRYEGL